jgi:hypothetical protein
MTKSVTLNAEQDLDVSNPSSRMSEQIVSSASGPGILHVPFLINYGDIPLLARSPVSNFALQAWRLAEAASPDS